MPTGNTFHILRRRDTVQYITHFMVKGKTFLTVLKTNKTVLWFNSLIQTLFPCNNNNAPCSYLIIKNYSADISKAS